MRQHVIVNSDMAARRRAQPGVGGGFSPNLIQPSEFNVSEMVRAPILDRCSLPVQEAISPTFDPTRVLLRRLFFMNVIRSRYVSVGFYPALNYRVLVEFGGPRIAPKSLTVKHLRTLWNHLPRVCDALCRNETYTCANDLFRMQTSATFAVAKMFLGKHFINFKLNELRCLITLLPFLKDQQNKYIPVQNDVMQYTVTALGSTQFVDPHPAASNLIIFYQLFDELKTVLI
jgi:hypothetical protein